MNPQIIAIGYGNELRSDDSIGLRVAKALPQSQIKSFTVHQLTPELAEPLANSQLAIFIDACLTTESTQVQVQKILPTSSQFIAGHTADPPSLLALTQALYNYSPLAWWIKVPGVNFELGYSLSPIAATGMAIALEKITQILAVNYAVTH